MEFRIALADDCRWLAEMNHRLIQDEGHRNPMRVSELEERMKEWVKGSYEVVIFSRGQTDIAYAAYQENSSEVYLRQLFVLEDYRRQGVGREVLMTMKEQLWPHDKRLTVEVLTGNQGAADFWRAVGYVDYSVLLEQVPNHLAKTTERSSE